MALTKFKQSEPVDTFEDTLCSVPGCGKRWSVKMEGSRPLCSNHQWGEKTAHAKKNLVDLLPSKPKTVAQWYDDKDEVY